MIKLLSFIYRLTGWYCPLVKFYEYRHLQTKWEDIEGCLCDMDISLENAVGIYIGTWQANNGFYRKLNMKKYKRWM